MIDLGAWATEKYKVSAADSKNDDSSEEHKERR